SKSGWLRALTGHKYSLLFGLLHPRTHQAKSTTKLNRYPEIFAAATKAAPSARKILSFGCSTGEECVTLANYFPTAQIIGADINVLNLLRTFRLPKRSSLWDFYGSTHIPRASFQSSSTQSS